jgi:hypothetical protein
MKQPLIRKGLLQDFRAEAERRLQLAQSGILNGTIATAYALLAIHDTLMAIHDTLIKIEDLLRSGRGREIQTPPPASQPTPASQGQITAA